MTVCISGFPWRLSFSDGFTFVSIIFRPVTYSWLPSSHLWDCPLPPPRPAFCPVPGILLCFGISLSGSTFWDCALMTLGEQELHFVLQSKEVCICVSRRPARGEASAGRQDWSDRISPDFWGSRENEPGLKQAEGSWKASCYLSIRGAN